MFFTLRPYQNEAIEAVYSHLCNYDTNPCVSLPTGSGKSIVMAEMVRRWKKRYPRIRVCILAHRKELIKQNYEKLKLAASDLDIGIFSASLNKKNYKASILFAGIDSIYKKHEEFWPFDLIFVDEAHRIPVKGEGKYRTFIQGCKQWNDALRVIGFTATPFRMDCGQVCHRDHILNVLCYEAKLIDLINDGYLCNLRSKVGTAIPSLSDVRRNGRGDYVIKSLAKATNKEKLVEEAVAEAVSILNAENRQSVLFFCVDVHHCNMVSRELYKHGILAPPITAHTPQQTRDKILNRFRNGKLREYVMCKFSQRDLMSLGSPVSSYLDQLYLLDCILKWSDEVCERRRLNKIALYSTSQDVLTNMGQLTCSADTLSLQPYVNNVENLSAAP